jgi:hypothetical protein
MLPAIPLQRRATWRRRESNPEADCHLALENKAFSQIANGLAADWQRNSCHSETASESDAKSMLDLGEVVAAWGQLPKATQQVIVALIRETTR